MSGVTAFVENKWSDARSIALDSVATAREAMTVLSGETRNGIAAAGLALEGFEFSDPPEKNDLTFKTPDKPEVPELSLDPLDNFARYNKQPLAPSTFPTAPGAFTRPLPTPLPKIAPSRPTVEMPRDMPAIVDQEYPNAPTLTFPTLPSPVNIPLPTLRVPNVDGIAAILDDLRSRRPTAPVTTLPSDAFMDGFNQLRQTLGAELEPTLAIEETLTWMLAGHSIGVPAAIATMLRDRAFAAEDRQAAQAEATAMTDWLARGFTLPGGALEAKLAEIRQQARDKNAQLNRDLWLEEAKLEIEQLRSAVTLGIQYQGLLWDTKNKLWSVCGDLANRTLDAQIKVLEATLSVFQAQNAAWQAEASVVKDYINSLLQSELAKLEITKAETEISKLFMQLNAQGVELYKAELEGVAQLVTVYRAQIDAANSRMQGEALKLEGFAKQVAAFSAAIGAYEAEWRGYSAAVGADNALMEGFKAAVSAYSSQVDAYGKHVGAVSAEISSRVEVEKLGLQAYAAELDAYKAELQKVSVEVEAKSKITDAQVRLFGALVGAEDSRMNSELKKVDQQLQQAQFEASIALKKADLDQTKAIELAKLAMSGEEAVARVASQLAGSALSAVSASAGITDSGSDHTSHNYNYDM